MENNNYYYENAPIIVAILQLRYDKIENFDIELLKKIAKNIEKDFPHVNPQIGFGISINDNESETRVTLDEKRVDGIQISSKDRKANFTINPEKFTFQSHQKYNGWNSVIENVKGVWSLFSNELNIQTLNAISLRYVNKFNLPLDTKTLNKYFTTYLNDDKNNYSITNFQLRFSSTDKENNIVSHIGHALEKPIEDSIPYLLDIDVVYPSKIENYEKELWPVFDKLREKKNQIFNEGITEEAKKLIN